MMIKYMHEYVALEFKYALNRTAMENIISFD